MLKRRGSKPVVGGGEDVAATPAQRVHQLLHVVADLLARAERAFRQHYGEMEAKEKDVPSDPLS